MLPMGVLIGAFWPPIPDYTPGKLVVLLALIIFLSAVGAGTFIIFYSLAMLKISFKDVRNVDSLLEAFISEMGFRPPERQGESLVVRATLGTVFWYSVLQLKATVSGNRVFLTGPMLLMRRLEKRLYRFSDNHSDSSGRSWC